MLELSILVSQTFPLSDENVRWIDTGKLNCNLARMARMHIVPKGGQIYRPRCIPDARRRDDVTQPRKIGFNQATFAGEMPVDRKLCLERGRRTFRNVSGRIVGTEITRDS